MRQLDGAERLLAETSAHTLTMVKCKPAEAEASLTAESTKRVEALDKIQDERIAIDRELQELAVQEKGLAQGAPAAGGSLGMSS